MPGFSGGLGSGGGSGGRGSRELMLMGGESSGELVIFPIESFYSLREYVLVTEVVEQESEDKYTQYTKHTRTRTMLGDVCPSSADKVYFCVTCDVQLR